VCGHVCVCVCVCARVCAYVRMSIKDKTASKWIRSSECSGLPRRLEFAMDVEVSQVGAGADDERAFGILDGASHGILASANSLTITL
jgi:hypothetical protein